MSKLIVGKEYTFKAGYKLHLEYKGKNCAGDICGICGKELKNGYCFADTIDGNPNVREVYGSECVNKVLNK